MERAALETILGALSGIEPETSKTLTTVMCHSAPQNMIVKRYEIEDNNK